MMNLNFDNSKDIDLGNGEDVNMGNSENMNFFSDNGNKILESLKKKFFNILKNCMVAEIKLEVNNCNLLANYYRIGALLNRILEILEPNLSELFDRNKVTGMI